MSEYKIYEVEVIEVGDDFVNYVTYNVASKTVSALCKYFEDQVMQIVRMNEINPESKLFIIESEK